MEEIENIINVTPFKIQHTKDLKGIFLIKYYGN
jgi:hypothetical protein